jgi:molecular chaperone Hsp33
MALVGTVDADELLDDAIGAERLLFRLFHERGVRVYEPVAIREDCGCSREKVDTVLRSMSDEERANAVEDGMITVRCEFCSTHYRFDPDAFAD